MKNTNVSITPHDVDSSVFRKNTQHYGLAATDYTHFTSPIRRYPDLIVHRLLHLYPKDHSNRTKEEWKERLPEIAKQSSDMEHRAVVTERIVDAMKKRSTCKIISVKFTQQP